MELDGLPSTATPPPIVTLTFDLLTQNPISRSTNSNASVTKKLGEIPFTGLRDMVFTMFSGHTDAQTYSQTGKPENRMTPAPF